MGLRVIGLVRVWVLLDVCSVERNGYGREMYR